MKTSHMIKKLKLKEIRKISRTDKFLMSILVAGGLIILFIAVYFLNNWNRVSPSSLLPADKSLMYFEVKDLNWPGKLQDGMITMNILDLLGKSFGLDITSVSKNLGDNGFIYALVKNENRNNQKLLFIPINRQSKALNYFKTLLLPNETLIKSSDKNPIYSYNAGQTFSFRFIKQYAVIAQNPETLKIFDSSQQKTLNQDENYIKSLNNLPRHPWILSYVNVSGLNFSDNPSANNIIEPLKYAVHNAALALRKDHEGFRFNTFLNLNKELISLEHGKSESKFAFALTDYISDTGIATYIGGANLESEWLNTLETISNLNPAYGVIMEGILRAKANEIFGSEVDLRHDLYPLFNGEYALALGKSDNGQTISLILSHDDRDFAEKKLEKLSKGFRFLAAKFAPKISVVILPDGTESRELVPDDGKLETSSNEVEGYMVQCTEVSETDVGFCYTVTDNLIIISNSKDQLLKAITPEGAPLLAENAFFRKTLANLSGVNDEVTFVDFNNFSSLFNSNQYVQLLQPLLSELEAGSWVKHYFADGMSAEGYVLVK